MSESLAIEDYYENPIYHFIYVFLEIVFVHFLQNFVIYSQSA